MSRRSQLIRRRYGQSKQFRMNRPKVDGIERKPMEVRIQPQPTIDPTKRTAPREALELLMELYPSMTVTNATRRASALFKRRAR